MNLVPLSDLCQNGLFIFIAATEIDSQISIAYQAAEAALHFQHEVSGPPEFALVRQPIAEQPWPACRLSDIESGEH